MSFVTGMVRFNFVCILEPKGFKGSEDNKKYSVNLLIPKTAVHQIEAINAEVVEATKRFKGKFPSKFEHPLRDGDDGSKDDYPEYAGCYYLNAKSSSQPGVVDADKNELPPSAIYSGCYGRAAINFYPYSQGKYGVAVGLNNLMFCQDGEPLDGRLSADKEAW